jgi:hypothetical protein
LIPVSQWSKSLNRLQPESLSRRLFVLPRALDQCLHSIDIIWCEKHDEIADRLKQLANSAAGPAQSIAVPERRRE